MGGESTDFLIYDSRNEHRILIFATNGGPSFLSSSNMWFVDGTFKCSSIFAQLYIIRVELEGNVRTCVYVFLPDKLENTYHEMLLNLVIASVRNTTPLKPERIIIDFELGVINIINRVQIWNLLLAIIGIHAWVCEKCHTCCVLDNIIGRHPTNYLGLSIILL